LKKRTITLPNAISNVTDFNFLKFITHLCYGAWHLSSAAEWYRLRFAERPLLSAIAFWGNWSLPARALPIGFQLA